MKSMNPANRGQLVTRGFTLVELLVVMMIVVVLAVLVAAGANRFIESGRKVKAMAQFRDFQVGMSLFEGDYEKPPIPKSKRDTGWDTIYGDPGGNYSTQFLISALAGEDKDYPYKGESFSSKDVNPRNESYMTFPFAPDKKGGVGSDGKLYDPWGGDRRHRPVRRRLAQTLRSLGRRGDGGYQWLQIDQSGLGAR